jgi:uncharacterized membrane protein YtjA (UPF0391 family)
MPRRAVEETLPRVASQRPEFPTNGGNHYSAARCPISAWSLLKGDLLSPPIHPKESVMLSWALAFFIVAIIAAVFGFTGIAAGAAEIAKILFVVFVVLFLVSLVAGLLRRP